jgi:hypothetical protein
MNVFAKCAPQRQQNERGRDGILERREREEKRKREREYF